MLRYQDHTRVQRVSQVVLRVDGLRFAEALHAMYIAARLSRHARFAVLLHESRLPLFVHEPILDDAVDTVESCFVWGNLPLTMPFTRPYAVLGEALHIYTMASSTGYCHLQRYNIHLPRLGLCC